MANEIQKSQGLNSYLELPAVNTRLSEKLGYTEALKFKAALSSAVSTNPVLATECEPGSVISAALIGHSLNLPPSPQLGYYYLVPYNNHKKKCKEAQFQIGYKGYIQLAMRSGSYRKLNATCVKEGEFVSWNPLTENLEVNFIEDPVKREEAQTIGYCGYFEYLNGFSKIVYWTIQQMRVHADKYSPAYSLKSDELLKAGKIPQKDLWKYSSFWYNNFDAMALKTMLRQMLSKWGSMSVDMQTAVEADLKSDSISFTQSQANNDAIINDELGSKVVDAEFVKDEDKTVKPDETIGNTNEGQEEKPAEDWLN